MIDSIKGTIHSIRPKTVVIQAAGSGISFAVLVAQEAAYTLNKESSLLTYLHWNQEQGPTLYGFETELDRTVFLLVISCSGIGPKIGLATLECLGGNGTLEAIGQENSTMLSKVPGIGKKKAEQIVVHLKDKVAQLITSGVNLADDSSAKQWQQITQVLTSLNYSRQEITGALQHVKTNDMSNAPFDHQLRSALSYLAKVR
ncbi:MAG: Holliday junction branch migration protein RuvA [Candidatus Babeliales bacterium]